MLSGLCILYFILYCLFCICLVFPPTEFVSAGLSIDNLLSGYIGSEHLQFIQFHIRKSAANLIFHSLLPLGSILSIGYIAPECGLWSFPWSKGATPLWSCYVCICLLLPVIAALAVCYYSRNNWSNHHIAQALAIYATSEAQSNGSEEHHPRHSGVDRRTQLRPWHDVATEINIEFRRIDKFMSSGGVVVTDNWICHVGLYSVHVIHQSDAVLSLSGSDDLSLSHTTSTGVQFLNITVNSARENIKPFNIRLNSLEFTDLKDKLQRPVLNQRDVTIHQTLSEKFLVVFRQCVEENPTYTHTEDVEPCIGCMRETSNVKLVKHCDDGEGEGRSRCGGCYCRPMWCLSCMGKWFASRQDQNTPDTWLSSQSPCPTCRNTFCVRDVCKLT